ncbi:ATP-binding protein [Nakamurella antarctica]|uniref:ATP-binding protein n=1 Tax=Nakamurella antarctica TaxID=1902245 RepID=A0A3G8ZHV7_9ACTN|nr:ATP-binding protein [Nakamurella antarctica]AZI56828.1 ATP-binding protein [Nakamurella antarctica]
MDSPYRPGFGAKPAVLVGRDLQLARAQAALTRIENSGQSRSAAMVFTGSRGLGKTVTLGVIGDRAASRGFTVAAVSMDRVSDNIQIIVAAVAEALRPLESTGRSRAWQQFKDRMAALSIEFSAGIVKIVADAPQRSVRAAATVQRQVLASLLVDAAVLSREHDKPGLVLLIDELQEAPSDQLVVLANAIQDATKAAHAPLGIFAAGLPQTPELVMAAASFTERFDFRTLGRLDHIAAERALLEPALDLGVRWDPAAAAAALDYAGGSPYLIQYIGDETWLQAGPAARSVLSMAHFAAAMVEVRESLDHGMFRGRWAKATPAEQAVISAIAQVSDGRGVAATAAISAALGVESNAWSMFRRSLMDKGIIEAAGHGLLTFTIAGFAEFVLQLGAGPDDVRPGSIIQRRANPALESGQ